MEGQGVATVEDVRQRVVALDLDVLRVVYAENLVGVLVEVAVAGNGGDGEQEVAGRLPLGADCEDVLLPYLQIWRRGLRKLIGVVEAVAEAHDEVVLVAVAEQRVVGGDVVDEVDCGLGQVDVVDVERCEEVAGAVPALHPLVCPSGVGDDAGVLGALLVAEGDVELGGGIDAALETLAEEGGLELREGESEVEAVLHVPIVDEAFGLAAEALVRASELGGECLGAAADVAVGVGDGGGHAEISLGVGAFDFERDCLALARGEQDVDVDPLFAVDFHADGYALDVDELEDLEALQGLVGVVDGPGGPAVAWAHKAIFYQDVGAQIVVATVDDSVAVDMH